ncbi:hypothetical protein [Bacillus thuringiensis]|uniref:hypothetical protein n=1 Tax=Bacillus thuringiensis TaxID=1428 RepID=UPI0011A8B36B|nr:hypothetical protein [Bacillus thuringiensis]
MTMRKGQLNVLRTTRRPTPQEWDELCRQAVVLREENFTYEDIAKKLGVHKGSVPAQLKKRGLWKSESKSIKEWDRICKQAVILREQGVSYTKISEKLNVNSTTMQMQLKKRNLWKVAPTWRSKEEWTELCKEAVILREQGLSYSIISKRLEVNISSMKSQLKKRKLIETDYFEQTSKEWDEICKEAVCLRGQGYSYVAIANKLKVPSNSVQFQLKKRGLWNVRYRSTEELDMICKQAVLLCEEGLSYSEIEQRFNLPRKSLLGSLKKRGLWKGVSEEKRQKAAREKWDGLCQAAVVLHKEGIGYPEIAKQLGCNESSLGKELKKRNLWRGISYEQKREKWDELCKQAVVLKKQGHGYKEISRLLGCQDSGLYIQLEKRGLLEADFLENNQKKWDELCKEAVILREEGWLYKEIAQKFGYKSTSILSKQLKRRGLWKGESRAESKEKWDKLCQQAAIIRKEHRFSYTQIALQLNCSNATLQQQLKKRGLYRKFHKDIKQEDYT